MDFLNNQNTHQELQITSAHALLDVLFIVLLVRLAPHTRANSRFLYAVFTILFTGSIVFSNQIYLKKNLEFESTISLMSRIVSRIEHQVDYRPGHTPVAFIGTPESSVLYTGRKGFDHLDALKAARGNYAITNDTDMIWYMWEVMGYPINFVDSSQLARLRENDIVKEMPAFPQEGCCTFIGDTLVMRLSP